MESVTLKTVPNSNSPSGYARRSVEEIKEVSLQYENKKIGQRVGDCINASLQISSPFSPINE